jgi:formylglycine-generating enzyme required for sulfatase activity
MVVPGGAFHQNNDDALPATVSELRLDRFEVNVARFRAFVEEYPVSWPSAGVGAHPRIAGSGWDPAWDSRMPVDQVALKASLQCEDLSTWTDEPGDHELLPMNCVSWYLAFAFCAWDGGRLPTEAELSYASSGGDEQRQYAWAGPDATATPDPSYAVYGCGHDGGCELADVRPSGSRSPRGDGRWKHADLAGNVWEWVLDSFGDPPPGCDDCAVLVPESDKTIRGGGWRSEEATLLSSSREPRAPKGRFAGVGVRCARPR